jgi:hypothetical protein
MGLTVTDGNEKSSDINAHYHNITADKVIPTTSPTPSSTTTTTITSTRSRTSTSTSSSTSSDPSTGSTGTGTPIAGAEKKGLSTGAVAGISVGCTAVGFAIIGGLIFWLWRRWRQNAAAKDRYGSGGGEKVAYAHWGGELSGGEETQRRAELHNPIAKMGHELDSRAVEAPTDSR